MPDPNAPVFSYDQVDPYSTQGGGQPVSLGTTEGNVGTPPGGDSYWYNYFRRGLNSSPAPISNTAPAAASASPAPVGYNTTNQDQARLEQQRVIQALQAQAAGDPSSQAQQQLRNAYGQAQAQQSSLGSTMRGQSAGAALRGIQQGQQDIARGLPGDQQMLQLQEQQAAQSMLAQMLQQQQQQDIAQAQGTAQGSLQGQGILSDYYRQLMGGALETGANKQQVTLGRGLAEAGFNLDANKINQQFYNDLMGAAQGATATAGTVYGNATKPSGSGYRQVDGSNSIVPEWDK